MPTLLIRCTLFAAACLLCAQTFAEVQTLYKSVGPDGKVSYTDRPPSTGHVEKTLKFENLPASNIPAPSLSYVEQLRRLRANIAATAPAPEAGTLILFSAKWCTYCKLAKNYLTSKAIAYQEMDIDTTNGMAAFAQAGASKAIPLLVLGDRRLQGFSAPGYDAFLSARK